jgi:8-oxo-dGTP diphosphatase
MSHEVPSVGLGVIIVNKIGQILLGKRSGNHAPYWSIPGGKLELGESFERGAIREVNEEHGIDIIDPEVIGVTNNLRTYKSEGLHFISVILVAREFNGEPNILEPEKCSELMWADPTSLPTPHFDASELGIKCYLENIPYVGLAE